MRRRQSAGDLAWNLLNHGALTLVGLAAAYPFVWVISASLSDPAEVLRGSVILLPRGFDTTNYGIVLGFAAIWAGYLNTLYYVIVGTTINIMLTMLFAYPLSRIWFRARGAVNLFMIVTMFFGGGMIPTFLVVKALGLVDKRWAMIIPGAVQAWYIIITRMFFQTIPESLIESAKLDGARESTILRLMILPLSLPIVAVLILFYAVGHWNSYFDALLYLADSTLHPVQLILMRILTENSAEITSNVAVDLPLILERNGVMVQIKYAIIVVVIAPIVCVYPFLQKYFVKGVLIGSLKG